MCNAFISGFKVLYHLFSDATDASAVKDFILNFAKQHCLIVNHMRKKCVSHLRDLIDCGGRLRVAIVPACLAKDTNCFNLVGGSSPMIFDVQKPNTVPRLYNTLTLAVSVEVLV